MKKIRFVLLFLALINAFNAFTQVDFELMQKFGNSASLTGDYGDCDYDGDIDIIIGNKNGVVLYKNQGNNQFEEEVIIQTEATIVKWVHINNDNFPDLIIGGSIENIQLTNNQGESFTQSNLPYTANIHDIDCGDLNNDGFEDIIIADNNDFSTMLLNNTSGGFTVSTTYMLPEAFAVKLADIDGDNDLDIVFATGGYSIGEIYLNNGSGQFQWLNDFGTQDLYMQNIDAGDVDNDGDIDFITGTGDGLGTVILWINDGAGGLTPTTVDNVFYAVAKLADIDNDNDLDVITGSWGSDTPTLAVYLNDNLNFTGISLIEGNYDDYPITAVLDVLPVDTDNDGDFDIVALQSQMISEFEVQPAENILAINQSTGSISEIGFKYNLNIHPNPAKNVISLFIDDYNPVKEIKLYNAIGVLILNRKICNNNVVIDVSNYTPGIYFIKYKAIIQKVIVK